MKPTRLTLDGFGSYAKADIDLTQVSLAAVVGENAAGKSTLIDAMLVALFGSSAGSLDTFIRRDADGFAVTLTFDHGGSTYSVTRELKRGRNQKAAVSKDGSVLADAKARDVDAAIIAAIGYDYDSFTIAQWLRQGSLGVFAGLDAAKRKEWVASVLPMEIWPLLEASAKESLKAAQERIGRYEAERDALGTEDVDALRAERDIAKSDLDSARQRSEDARSAANDARDRIIKRQDERSRIERAKVEYATAQQEQAAASVRLDRKKAELATLPSDAPDIEPLEAAVEELSQAMLTFRTAQQERVTLIRDGQTADARFAKLSGEYESAASKLLTFTEQESPVCDRCGQHVAGEAHKRTLSSLESEAAALKEQSDAAFNEAKKADAALAAHVLPSDPSSPLAEMQAALTDARLIATRVAKRDALISEVALLEEAFTKASDRALELGKENLTAPVESSDADKRIIDAESSAAAAYQVTVRAHATAEAKVKRAEKDSERVLTLTSQIADISRQASDLTLLVKAYGKSGVQARLIEAAVIAIEDEANAYLSRFGLGLSVELRTQRENKTGAGVREVLDILVSDGEGTLPIERASGGEKTRINFALAVGLSRFLSAGKGGSPIESFVLDEPEYLDQSGLSEFIACLYALADTTPFVLVVSHLEGMVDALPQRIVVRKGVNGSKVEVA